MDLLGAHADVPIHAAAAELQGIAFPAAGDVELLGDVVGDALDLFLRLGQRYRVVTQDVDAGHFCFRAVGRVLFCGVLPSAPRTDPPAGERGPLC